MNNVFSAKEYVETNRNIFNVVQRFRETNSNVTILLMDLAALSTSFVLRNALAMGALASIVVEESNETTATDTEDVTATGHVNITYFQELLSYYASHEEETNTYSLAEVNSQEHTIATPPPPGSSNEENGKGTPLLVQILVVLLQQRLRKKRLKLLIH
jgi:hypothetical protein